MAGHRGVRALAADRPLLVVASSHSAPMRAFAATALGHDPGEPHNLEDIRVRVADDGSATVAFRDAVVPYSAIPAMPPWFG